MAKINIDTDMISNTLIPLAKNECSKLGNVISIANQVNFPSGEFNWSGIIGELEDCQEMANKYYNWIVSVRDSFVNNMNDRIDEINSSSVTEVKKRYGLVK